MGSEITEHPSQQEDAHSDTSVQSADPPRPPFPRIRKAIPAQKLAGYLAASTQRAIDEERLLLQHQERLEKERQTRTHYYVKVVVSSFLCALLLIIGVPVFMESRVTGSLAYTALGIVLVGFGLILAASVVVLLFKPPFSKG